MAQPGEVVVAVSGVGLVTRDGEGPARLENFDGPFEPPVMEEVEPGLVVPVGRLGRLARHPFRERFERMNQLDALSQYAFIATGYALDDAELDVPDERFEDTGVIFGSCFGCQEANYRFDQFSLDPESGPEGVRPAIFKNTVDNVPAGWVSLGYQLRGLNATLVSGRGAGAEAILSALWALQLGRATRVVAGGVERLLKMQVAAQHRQAGGAAQPYLTEGGAMVLLETAAAAEGRGHRPRARVVEAGRSLLGDGALSSLAGVDLVSVVAEAGEKRSQILDELGELPLEPLIESERIGDAFAAQGPLAFALLIERLRRSPSLPGRGLLVAEGEGQELFHFLIEASH